MRRVLPRVIPLVCAALLVSAALTDRAAAADASKERPYSFVVIMADDLGAGELACYGNTRHATPNLDRLAAEGTRFQTCWATPLCTPTRVMLMTGQYAFRTGYYNLIGRQLVPKPGTPLYDVGSKYTFADLLKSHGYKTALAGKWQLTGEVPNLVHDCGFDEYLMWAYAHNLPPGVQHTGGWEGRAGSGRTARYWHPALLKNGRYVTTKPTDYGPDLFNDFLIDFIKRSNDGKAPFVAYYPIPLTHGPHDPTPDFKRPGEKTPKGFQYNVEYMDHLIGRIAAAVDEAGLKENTVILFTGDNGTAGAGKGQTTEHGARVPLIVRCPGTVKAGVVTGELASLVDVLPTLADFAGATLPKDQTFDGKSLAPLLRGEPGASGREWLFSYLGKERMLRDKRWLLEGDGRLFDCGDSRDGTSYRDVTDSKDPEVAAARERFERLLKNLPAPSADQNLVGFDAAENKPANRNRRRRQQL
jgi:arylsulfatase A